MTREELDDLIAGKLSALTGGPIPRADVNAVATALADYVDGATTTNLGSVPSAVEDYVTCVARRAGNMAILDFAIEALPVTHTDATSSGSSGSAKIWDWANFALLPLGCRTNMTLTGDNLIDGDAGDMAGVFALGSAAANAGDGALTGTEVDYAATAAFTLSDHTLAKGTVVSGVGTAIDGTSTAAAIYLNESGSAATSDANGVLTFSGTITLVCLLLGDD